MQYSIAVCSRPEPFSHATSGICMRLTVPYKSVQFRDPRLKCSQEIQPEAVESDIFDGFFHDNFPPEVDSDVLSGVDEELVGMDVHIKFGQAVLKIYDWLTL